MSDKMCHSTAQNVPQHGTNCAQHGSKRLLGLCATGTHKICHTYHGTKRLLGKFCFFYIRKNF
jgi:hypothetical protein